MGRRERLAILFMAVLTASTLRGQSTQQRAVELVRGRVIDAVTGDAVPYPRLHVDHANTVVRGTIDGSFSMAVPPSARLIVTKAGYVAVEQTVRSTDQPLEVRMTRAAAIAGRVVNDSGEPVVGATVTTTSSLDGLTARAVTDDRGGYRLGGLPPARYGLSVETLGAEAASAAGVAEIRQTTTVTYFPDTRDPSLAGSIPLSPAAERRDVDFHIPVHLTNRQPLLVSSPLPRLADMRAADSDGATIRGTVADPQGRPLPYAQVTLEGDAIVGRERGAGPLLSTYRTAVADERGAYEFAGLRGGFYVARAAKAGYSPAPPARPVVFGRQRLTEGAVRVDNLTLVPWGVITGRLHDEYGDAVPAATVRLLQQRYERGKRRLVQAAVSPRTSDDRGEFRLFAVPPGEYVVAASVDGNVPELVGYAQTFYPGTSASAEARIVPIGPGAEVSGIDVILFSTETARVTGRAFDASGKPATQMRMALVATGGVDLPLRRGVEPDGTFEFTNVPPGRYVLRGDAGGTNTFTEGPFAALALTVGEADLTDVRLQALPGSTITGRFLFDSSSRSTEPPSTAMTVAAVPGDFDLAPSRIASAQANAEGVFQLRNVTGERRLQLTRTPPGYMLQSILLNGRDITDELVTFGRAQQAADNVEIMLTDRVTRLAITVRNALTLASAGVQVVGFSTDRERWYPASRYMQHQATGPDGRVMMTGLPSGSYFVATVPAVPEGSDSWQDPVFLETVRDAATVVVVGDGTPAEVELNLPGR